MASSQNPSANFHDYLPVMADKLGGDGLIGELCNGFNLLMDSEKGVITFESLKRNSALLGLQDLSDDDLRCMLKEGDFDGDGALNQMEFCVLMFRLSPELMEESKFLLEEALLQEDSSDDEDDSEELAHLTSDEVRAKEARRLRRKAFFQSQEVCPFICCSGLAQQPLM